MYNRTLNRPMFRRGGRAGGGIMTGVQRQGYDGEDGKQIVEKNDMEKVAGNMESFNKAFPQYPYAASDFFMNLGTNILAQPGGNPILQTIGTAAGPALQNLQKTRQSNTEGQRALALQFWKSMDDDEKDALINRAEQMVKAGRFGSVEEALQVLVPTYRKDASPQEIERKEKLDEQKQTTNRIDDILRIYSDDIKGRPDAIILDQFFTDIENKKFEVPHDPEQYFIDDGDVGRGTTDAEKRLVIKDYNPEQSEYKEGRVYIDFITKKAFVKQGQFLIPYEDYISQTISTG